MRSSPALARSPLGTAAVDGELGPVATAAIYCTTISACHRVGDYRRAEWTEAVEGCSVRSGMAGFPGDLSRPPRRAPAYAWHVDRGGARSRAASLVEGGDSSHVGMALYEAGEIRLRRGDFAAADEAFRRAEVTPSFTPAQTPSERALRR